MNELQQKVEQWYHIPRVAGQIFTLIGVHFFELKILIIGAVLIDLFFSILKYMIVSSFEIVYMTIGHSLVMWIWSIGTLIYFIIQGDWLIGAYALAYYAFFATIAGLPGIIVIDGIVGKMMGRHCKYFAVERFCKE